MHLFLQMHYVASPHREAIFMGEGPVNVMHL